MQDPSDKGYPAALHGMDPGKLLGVLGSPPEPPEIPGWVVLKLAGTGGSGHVWKAVRQSDGALAAIKFAPAGDLDTVERIEHEADVLQSLNHPNVVKLLESGPLETGAETAGLYLAMEFIEGCTLADEIPVGGMEPGNVYRIFGEIASAVSAAHDSSILHRDLKPANVLINEAGKAKLGDFGLARPVHQRVQQLSLTRAGVVAGTAEYLPPEAYLRDYKPDVAGDVFALGVVLYEMLTGSPPRGAWLPASSREGVDVRIDGIIRKAIDPAPEKRWPDADTMVAAMDEITGSPPRFSGTPLVTFPVRVVDALWTLLGLFVFISSTACVLRLTQSKFAFPFDLTRPYGELAGAFHALFWLLPLTLPLSLWQMVRLFRFRSVPMRESLPSPLGMKLGTGKTAAVLTAVTQFFVIVLPVLNLGYIHFEGNSDWLASGDPPWRHGLAVVPWEDTEVLSPWMLPELGKNYWLVESFGLPGHPLSEEISRLHFLPGISPVLMALSGGLLFTAVFVTAGAGVFRWVSWRRNVRASGLALLGVLAVLFMMHANSRARSQAAHNIPKPGTPWANNQLARKVTVLAGRILACEAHGTIPGFLPAELALYAPLVNYRDSGEIPRAEIPTARNVSGHVQGRVAVLRLDGKLRFGTRGKSFVLTSPVIAFNDPEDPGAPSTASLLTLVMRGEISDGRRLSIFKETLTVTPVYSALRRAPDPTEISDWCARLMAATAPESPPESLGAVFHARLIRYNAVRPASVAQRLRVLSETFATGGPFVSASQPRLTGSLPGGRHRILLRVKNLRTGTIHEWTAHLIVTEQGPKCVKLDFSP